MSGPRVVVAGGGITGLAAAFTLREEAARRGRPVDVVVLEAGGEAGGHARTITEGGFVVERGPSGFLDRGEETPDTLALVDELNLRSHLVPSNPARRRFILSEGALKRVPDSPPALVRSDAIGWRAKLRMLREPWAPPAPDTDETVFEFAERRLGREAAETFVDTAVAGISGGDSRALSLKSQFPRLKEMERAHGSLLKAMLARRKAKPARLMSFDLGMRTVTGTIATRLDGALRLNSPVECIEKRGDTWRVQVAASGPSIVADRVVLALPSHAAARLVSGFDPDLARPLASIPYADLAMVALAYRTSDIARPLDGFGYLVTRSEGLATLGVLWESSIFPGRAPDGAALLRVMLGGARRPDVGALDDQSLAQLAVKEAAGVLGISGRPLRQWVCRWPAAIAQYTVGHEARLAEITRLASAHCGLHLCGTAYDGVSFNDAIASARRTARAIAQELLRS